MSRRWKNKPIYIVFLEVFDFLFFPEEIGGNFGLANADDIGLSEQELYGG